MRVWGYRREDVANILMYEDLSGVVLVGNSSGGMVITGVADGRRSGSGGWCTSTPLCRRTANACWTSSRPIGGRRWRRWSRREGAGWLLPRFAAAPWERFVPEVWQVTDAADLRWNSARLAPTPFGHFTEPVRRGNLAARRCRGPTFAACGGRIWASTTKPMQPAAWRGGVAASLRPCTFHTSPIPASWLPYCSKTLCRPKSSRNPPANHPAITLAAAVRESGRLAKSVGVGNPDLLEPEQWGY